MQQCRELSGCESVLMKAIWDKKEDISLMELREVLKTKFGKNYSRTTVSTFLLRLSQKGFVKTYKVGKNSYIHPIRKEDEYKRMLMEKELDFWFAGRPSALMAALCDDRELSKTEADKIRDILDGFEN